MHVHGIVGGVGEAAVLHRRSARDGNEMRAVRIGRHQPVSRCPLGSRPGHDGHLLQQHRARAAVFQNPHAGRGQELDVDKARGVAAVDDDRMGGAVGDRDRVADRDRQLAREAIVGAPAQLNLDQPWRNPFHLGWREEVPRARLQRLGAAVHDLEKAVGDGREERRIVGISGIDLDSDLDRGLVERGDGALRERQRIIVDGEIANRDVAGPGNRHRRPSRGVDQLRAVAFDLKTVQFLEGEGAIDPVDGVPAEIEDDMKRPSGPGRITGRFGDRRERLGEGGIGIAAIAQESRHVENRRARSGSRLRPACAAPSRCRREKRGGELDRPPPAEGPHAKAPLATPKAK